MKHFTKKVLGELPAVYHKGMSQWLKANKNKFASPFRPSRRKSLAKIAGCLVFIAANCYAYTPMDEATANRYADAIYKVEGGSATRYPYGIKSIKTSNPRQVCINTVKNNYIRWQKSGSKNNFTFFLADKYCPASVDAKGNQNWKNNITKLLKGN